jgi:hypothetical protein
VTAITSFSAPPSGNTRKHMLIQALVFRGVAAGSGWRSLPVSTVSRVSSQLPRHSKLWDRQPRKPHDGAAVVPGAIISLDDLTPQCQQTARSIRASASLSRRRHATRQGTKTQDSCCEVRSRQSLFQQEPTYPADNRHKTP